MKGNHIKWLTGLGIIAIISIFMIQIFWVRQAFTISENQFEHTINVALRQVAEKISIKNKTNFLTHNPVIKIDPRHYIVQVNSEIDAALLDHYLKTVFDYFNINQDVEYSIFSCEDNALVYCNYIQKKNPQKSFTTPDLPKFEGLDYYFSVSFPHYPIISMNNIPMWMITSFVLVLLVLFFVFALFIVFNQKSISQVQREFINNMTHEFKTPITTISVIQQAIADPDIIKNPKRLATYTEIIGVETQRLNTLVEKVLHVTKLEKNKFDLHLEPLDVHEIISQAVHNMSHAEHEYPVEFKVHLEAVHHIIDADKVHFTNVICNILENAVKYSPMKAEISVETTSKNRKLKISIQDNGEGIDKKEIKKIFDKFYRIPKGDTHNVKGFGLGLFYVKQVADAHKWEIDVDSMIGMGTVFTITIPLKN
ncbi:MAG: HAMP domain-containing sensor histidine kinase [Saprospiraceae bacterium]